MMRIALRVGWMASAVLLLGSSLTPGRADAAFATFTETATGSGTFNGVSFTNALITVTGTGDTANIFTPAGTTGVYALSLTSNSVTVAGFAPASFTLPNVQAYVNTITLSAGFVYGPNGFTILATGSGTFGSSMYNLSSSIGPVSGTAIFNSGLSLTTTGGPLVLNSVANPSTYQAVVSATTVPEPSSLALCGVALLAGAGFGLRRLRDRAGVA